MPIGDNVLKDKIIKNTTEKQSKQAKGKTSTDKTNITNNTSKRSKASTADTIKMTFYVKKDLLQRFYNFAYWERYNVTDAFNMVLENGLKGKKIKQIPEK